jgi:hypothetical protein
MDDLTRLLAQDTLTPAQERRVEQMLAQQLPTRAESWTPPAELTELFLNRQRAIRKRVQTAQRQARLATWLAAQAPGTPRTC